MGKGEKRPAEGNTITDCDSQDTDSYTDKASKYKWKTAGRRDKKYESNNHPNDDNVPDLSGVEEVNEQELFVESLSYAKCRNPRDHERMVTKHCRVRGVDIIYAKAFLLRFDKRKANCRITLKEGDVEKVLNSKFWPESVTVREWTNNPDYNSYKSDKSSDA